MLTCYKTARALLVCAVGGVVFAAFLIGCSTHSMHTKPITLRVMTYNIHHGEGLDGKVDLLRIAQLIQREGADIVALQEVDKGVARTARRDLPAELAELTGMACVFSNNFPYQGGEYGNAVLTRFPVRRVTNTRYQMLRAGDPDAADRTIAPLLERFPADPKLLHLTGLIRMHQQRHQECAQGGGNPRAIQACRCACARPTPADQGLEIAISAPALLPEGAHADG